MPFMFHVIVFGFSFPCKRLLPWRFLFPRGPISADRVSVTGMSPCIDRFTRRPNLGHVEENTASCIPVPSFMYAFCLFSVCLYVCLSTEYVYVYLCAYVCVCFHHFGFGTRSLWTSSWPSSSLLGLPATGFECFKCHWHDGKCTAHACFRSRWVSR